MAALRLPTSASQYHTQRQLAHAREEEARKQQEEQDWIEAAAKLGVIPETPLYGPRKPLLQQTPEAPPAPTVKELHASGRKKIEKAKRATQSQVRASKANEVSARAHAEKKIKQWEAAGKL